MQTTYFVSLFTLALSFSSLFYGNQASPCDRVIKRYYECKQGSTMPENIFQESFFHATLGNMSIEQTLDLQREIYESAYNCSSEFCKCVGVDEKDLSSTHAVFFSTQQMYTEFKQVILNLIPSTNTTETANEDPVEKFCSRYNVLFEKTSFFTKNLRPMCRFDSMGLLEFMSRLIVYASDFNDCLMSDAHELDYQHFYNPLYVLDTRSSSKSDEMRATVCLGRAFGIHTVCSRDEQRFLLLAAVPEIYRNVWVGETSVYTFADSITDRIERKEIIRRNKSASLYTFLTNTYITNLENGRQNKLKPAVKGNQSVSLFSSSEFNITGNFVLVRRFFFFKFPKLQSITITSKFDEQNTFNRTFDLDVTVEPDTICSNINSKSNHSLDWFNVGWELTCDCSIANPAKASDKMWIRLMSIRDRLSQKQSIKILDFKWNIFVHLTKDELRIETTDSLTRQALGPLVNGSSLDV